MTPLTAPELVPAIVGTLVGYHTAAAALEPPDDMEQQLCARILIMLFRTSCAPQLLAALLSRLRHYEGHSPPSAETVEWLGWRAARLPNREPLEPYEMSALQLLIMQPHELHTLLLPHLPLLLHTCVVCYGPEASSLLDESPNARRAQGHAAALVSSLLQNLTPRTQPMPLTHKQVSELLARGHRLPSGLPAVASLVQQFSDVSPSLRGEWCELALHWGLHAVDPDLSLTSLRAFAALVEPTPGDWCNAELLHTLTLSLWGALTEGASAKAQLLLRLMRTLPLTSVEPPSSATWLQLGAVAASALSCRYEALFLEALQLLQAILDRVLPAEAEAPTAGGADGGRVRDDEFRQELMAHLVEVWRHDVEQVPPP